MLAETILLRSRFRYVAALDRVRFFRRFLASALQLSVSEGPVSQAWHRAAAAQPSENLGYHLVSKDWTTFRWAHVFLSTLATFLVASAIGWCTAVAFDKANWLHRSPYLFGGAALFLVSLWLLQWHCCKFFAAREDLRNRQLFDATGLKSVYRRSCRRVCVYATLCIILAVAGSLLMLVWSRGTSAPPSETTPGTWPVAWLCWGCVTAGLLYGYIHHRISARHRDAVAWPLYIPDLPELAADEE